METNILWAFPIGLLLGIFAVKISCLVGYGIAQIIIKKRQAKESKR